jgi:hypothetical protein
MQIEHWKAFVIPQPQNTDEFFCIAACDKKSAERRLRKASLVERRTMRKLLTV